MNPTEHAYSLTIEPMLWWIGSWIQEVINVSLVANIQFLGKVLEQVVAGQLQALLDETDYLDPFQSGFRPRYGTESALVTLYDDLCREKDRGSVSLLVFLDLSAAFNTIDHGETVAVLNRCLAEVMGWVRANKLKLNPGKAEVLLVGDSSFQGTDSFAAPFRRAGSDPGILAAEFLRISAGPSSLASLGEDQFFERPSGLLQTEASPGLSPWHAMELWGWQMTQRGPCMLLWNSPIGRSRAGKASLRPQRHLVVSACKVEAPHPQAQGAGALTPLAVTKISGSTEEARARQGLQGRGRRLRDMPGCGPLCGGRELGPGRNSAAAKMPVSGHLQFRTIVRVFPLTTGLSRPAECRLSLPGKRQLTPPPLPEIKGQVEGKGDLHRMDRCTIRWIRAWLMDCKQRATVSREEEGKESPAVLGSGTGFAQPVLLSMTGGGDKESADDRKYMDDTKAGTVAITEEQVLQIQKDLVRMWMWVRVNKVAFNVDKRRVLALGTKE
ncbi:RNA-directed DNA polymerase from mobile element jockey [Varanus komodoensis]|nr:RNA-directed DNA polymerase from mobile element jockey [Varanus komodoensis]